MLQGQKIQIGDTASKMAATASQTREGYEQAQQRTLAEVTSGECELVVTPGGIGWLVPVSAARTIRADRKPRLTSAG